MGRLRKLATLRRKKADRPTVLLTLQFAVNFPANPPHPPSRTGILPKNDFENLTESGNLSMIDRDRVCFPVPGRFFGRADIRRRYQCLWSAYVIQ